MDTNDLILAAHVGNLATEIRIARRKQIVDGLKEPHEYMPVLAADDQKNPWRVDVASAYQELVNIANEIKTLKSER